MNKGYVPLAAAAVCIVIGARLLVSRSPADNVPTETLPPNYAARELDRQAAEERRDAEANYIKQQRGHVLFGFVPLPAVDKYGNAVHDKSGKQIMDGSCLIWKSHWVTNNTDVPMDGNWYAATSFRVNPQRGLVQVYELKAPNGVVTEDGFQREPGSVILRVNLVAQLEDQPKPEWGCSNETWISVLTAEDRYIPPVMPWGMPNSNDPYMQKYHERQKQNCQANPQIYHGRC
ncbi:MAG TPA: hypothetical protein VGD08_17120 [Stellaceae bacterium]|jgi:hypothetical protein